MDRSAVLCPCSPCGKRARVGRDDAGSVVVAQQHVVSGRRAADLAQGAADGCGGRQVLAWEGSGRGVYVAYCEIQIDHDGVPLKDLKGLSLSNFAKYEKVTCPKELFWMEWLMTFLWVVVEW